ncbi:hypothetical protein OFR22_04725 [Brachyspira hyodysenteriae]|uniref:Uncharacterized protein n=2 Tax=Brachyspira hyodysenteriae TaxID=159 RepID=A0A3B6V9T5_BRAHW|nr:hypothetical protein [Brachyspira hyodysenteriae]ACN84622.1 hypothetical protein BHWA1_02164 [Brachyspira hyodysenteriae WA1]ANN63303.1 hypothetical protein BHYOB78_05335 [Brachyspira hyodysenteriae ATCC 27164]AUJ50357.1 hypothetical protein BH718_01924 [Brachyspira hyodysenteriae]KLI13883.1 hypothetical protein SU45_11845 [Brachyspira hyodysenteriae]KLI19884.1 hypothetical protein SU46_05670 [Brachyspira hyodysenteriae]
MNYDKNNNNFLNLTNNEIEYLNFCKDANINGKINSNDRKILNELKLKYKISDERALKIELYIPYFENIKKDIILSKMYQIIIY